MKARKRPMLDDAANFRSPRSRTRRQFREGKRGSKMKRAPAHDVRPPPGLLSQPVVWPPPARFASRPDRCSAHSG
jgi:hypothetical protein